MVTAKSQCCFLASPREFKEVKDQHSYNYCFSVSCFFIYWHNRIIKCFIRERVHIYGSMDSCMLWWSCPDSLYGRKQEDRRCVQKQPHTKDLLYDSLIREPTQSLGDWNSLNSEGKLNPFMFAPDEWCRQLPLAPPPKYSIKEFNHVISFGRDKSYSNQSILHFSDVDTVLYCL